MASVVFAAASLAASVALVAGSAAGLSASAGLVVALCSGFGASVVVALGDGLAVSLSGPSRRSFSACGSTNDRPALHALS